MYLRNFCVEVSGTIGSTNDWLPSRKSVESHLGAFVIVLFGHWRSGKLTGGNGLYFVAGFLSLKFFSVY